MVTLQLEKAAEKRGTLGLRWKAITRNNFRRLDGRGGRLLKAHAAHSAKEKCSKGGSAANNLNYRLSLPKAVLGTSARLVLQIWKHSLTFYIPLAYVAQTAAK